MLLPLSNIYSRGQGKHTVVREAEDPIAVLYESCGRITAQMAEGWFRHAGHYVDVEN
jgi:hypothetical protein